MATITSIIRQNPTGSPTNIDSVVFRVTFSEDVQNVNTDDFELSGTAASDGSITSVTPFSASEYDITIDGVGNSNGSINLDISPTQNITAVSDSSPLDTAIAPLTEETFTLDNTAPLLTSVTRAIPAAALTNADTLTFRATFDDSVTNVTGDDFVITGPTGVTITATQVSGDPTAYNIQVSGGDLANFNGNVDIALAGGADISDAAGNLVNATGATFESYELDNTAPVLQSFERLTPLGDTTNADSITFLATFSEAVENVGVNDFVINTVPASGTASITSVTPSATNPTTQYEITIGSGIGFYNGEIGIDLAASPTIRDLANNALPTGEPVTDETYTLDNIAATIQSVTAVGGAGADGSYRAGETIEIAVQFSEDVTVTGTPELQLETGITDAVATYDRQGATPDILIFSYTVADGENAGDLNYRSQNALVLPAGATVSDAAGNDANLTLPALTGVDSLATNQDIVIDTVLPTVTSIARLTPANALTAEDTLIFRVTFSEAVDAGTIDAGDFAVTGSTATVTGVAPFSATEYDLTVSGGDLADFDGVVGLDLAAPTITDVAGNSVVDAEPPVDQTYQLDNTAPTITGINSTTPDGEYNAGETLSIQVTFSEAVIVTGTPTLTLNSGGTATYVSGSNSTTLIFNYTVGAGDTDTLDLDVTGINLPGGAAIADEATNNAITTLPVSNLADNKELVIDNTVPTLVTVTRQTPTLDPVGNPDGRTNADSLTFRVTFSEEMVGVGIDDFAATGTTATVSAVTPVGAAGTVFDVTLSGGDLAGLAADTTIGLDFAGTPSLTDVAGNAVDTTLPTGANYETFIVENTAPTVTGVTSTTADGTYGVGTDIDIEVTFDEIVFVDTTNGTPTLDLNSGGSTIAQYVSGDGTDTLVFRYTVVDGEDSVDLDYDGTTSLQLNGGTIRDLATNDATVTLAAPGDAGSISDDQDIVVDTTEPTVVSIVRQVPTDAITAEDSLTFRVTFSEEVDPATVEATDFTVNGVTVAVASATPAGSNDVFDVVVNDAAIANFNGEVGLDVTGEIRDAGDNILNTAEPTTDETFTLDNTVPSILNITSSTPDAIYNEGDVISIQVEFSEAVSVTGAPTLTLDNGATAEFDSVSDSTVTFTYTVQAGDTDTSDLNVATVNIAADEIEDVAGNDAAATPLPAGNNLADNKDLVIDNTVPTLLTVTRQTPTLDPVGNPDGRTNADSLTFRVTFSEEMVGVGIDDFTATGTTATVSAVTPVGATGTVFDVTLSGGDLAGLAADTTIGLDFAGTPSLTDVAGNAVDTTLPTGADYETFIVENTAPTITGVTSTTPDGTYGVGPDIDIEVTFDEIVFVDTTNGTPTLDLNSGGSTIAQYVSGDGTDTLVFRYTVVDGEDSVDLDYDGTTSLQLNGGTIRDLATNDATVTLAAPGDAGSISDDQDIVVDTTEPTVVSIVRQVPTDAITAEDSLTFRVTFSEEVDPATVEATDFTVNGVTVAVASATPAGSNDVFDVVVNDAAIANFNGEVGLDVTGEIRDAGDNILNTAEPTTDETFTLDNTVPSILNITSSTPDAIYNEGDVISIQVEFSEAVSVTGAPTLTLDNGATAEFDSVSDSTVTFTYTVQAGDTDTSDLNVATVNIAADEIEDVAGNDAAATPLPAGNNLADNKDLVIDNTVPTLLTVTRQTPTLDPVGNPDGRTNADSLTFRVTFSEEMVGVGIDDFTATGTTATVSAVTPVGATGTVFDVTLSGGDLAGLAADTTIGLDFAGTPSLTDVAGNAVDTTLPTGADYETFIVENTAPTITGVTSTTPDGTYGVGTDIDIEVTFDEIVFVDTTNGTPTLNLNSGGSAVAEYVSGDGTDTLLFRYTVADGEDSLDLDYDGTTSLQLNGGTIRDLAANDATVILATPGTANSISDDQDIVVDTTEPTVVSIVRQDPTTEVTNADALTFRVTFSEEVDQATVEAGDFTVNGVVVPVTSVTAAGSDAVFDVVVDGGAIANFNGVVGLDVTGEIQDAGGNILNITEPTTDETFTLDNTAPAITNITSSTPDGRYNAGNTISIQVEFDGPINVDPTNQPSLDLSNGATATFVSVSGNTLTFSYTIAGGDAESADLDVTTVNTTAGSITDAAGNDANVIIPAGENLADEKDLIVDTVDPTLVSITRLDPAIDDIVANPTALTNSDSVVFQVTFSEAVRASGVTAADFLPDGTTATITSVEQDGGTSETVFNITLLGGDLATLDGLVGLDLSPTAIIQDLAGNNLNPADVANPDETFTLDNTAPTVQDVAFDNTATPDGTYSAGDVITILITFSEAVTVTGAPELTLDSGGTATYDSSSPDGTVLTFLYTVVDGDTSADLDYTNTNSLVLSGGAIADLATNAATLTLPAPGAVNSLSDDRDVIVDTTQPTTISIERETPNVAVTNEDTLVFRVTFSEDVTGTVDAADFVVDGTSTATVTNVTAVSGTEYDVEVSGGDLANFNGTVGLNLSGTADIDDAGGNNVVIAEPTIDELYTLDNIAPVISTITSTTPDDSYNSGDVISIQITFDGAVTVDIAGGTPNLTLDSGGAATYDSISADGTVLTFLYTVADGDTSDDLDVTAINLNGGVIADAATNAVDLTLPTGSNLVDNSDLVIDTAAPTLVSILRQTPALDPIANPDNLTNADELVFQLTFSEAMEGVGIADFAVTGNTTATVTDVSAVGSTGTVFNVTVSGGDLANLPGNEDIGLEFAAGADLTDVADNAVDPTLPAAPDDNQTFTVENTPPQVVDVDFDGTATPDGTYGIGDDVTILVTFSEAVTVTGSPTLTLDSGGTATYSSSSPDGTVLTFLYTVGAGEDSADLDYGSTTALNLSGGTIADIATNAADLALVAPGDPSSLSDDRDVVIDTAQPTVLSILRQDPTINPTNADTLTFRVTFSEVVDPATVEAADFTVDGVAAIVASATPVGGDNAVYDVVIDDAAIANFNGEVGLNLAAGATVTDAGGNNVAIAEPPATSDQTYTLDNTAPIITSITSETPDGSYNAGDIISIQVTFDGVVQVDTIGGDPTLTLNSGGTATYDSISTDGTVLTFLYTVADGEDTDDLSVATLELNGGVLADAATNDAVLTLPAGANLDVSSDLIIDTVAPTLNSILRQTPALNPTDNPTGRTNADELVFRLTFSEAMDGVGIADFAVTGTTTATVTNVAPVGMGGTIFDVTVSGGNLAGLAGDETIGVAFAPGAVLTDVAGNQVEATLPAPPDNQTFVVENTLPTVTDVTSVIADGTYGVGEEIDITITFSEVVFVTGAPTLTLNSGGTADYLQGDGTDTLTFRYTVVDGDNSADLDYASTSALTLNGGSISDLATNGADLTLAALDPTGLLGDNKAIVIDTENPTVVSILRETPADELTNATSLVFRVTFSEDVTGTVEIADFAVNSTSTATVTAVTPVSGTEYDVTVSGGNLASFNGTIGLDLATGADIDDVSGNNVLIQEPTPAENDQTYTLDTTAPTVANVTSPLADGTYRVGDIIPITITFSEVVTVTGTPTLTLETGATDAVASFVEGSGTDTLTFSFTVQAGEATDDLEYVAGNSLALAGGATIVDAAGNAATLTLPNTGNTGSLGFNKEIAIDTVVPELTSIARQDPTDELTTATSVTFRLTFSEAVENINPADFTITGGSTATVSNVSNVGGNVVFDVTVSGGDIGDDTFSGTLGLALAPASDIGDAAGNLAIVAGGAVVETYTFDNTAPAITNVTAQQVDGIYDVGDEILIDVTFDDVVTVAGVPTLALETGEDDAIATYVSGDGTDTLTFTYTVRAGDETVDLDYLATDALALEAGATIQDAFGNNADLTLPEPGAANSLGANRDIRIDTVAPELQSITRQTPEGRRTNANSLVFLVSFSEDVENLDAADFTITGNSTATVTGITPSTETPGDYAVTVSGGDLAGFNGQVGLVINDGAQDITDPAGRDLELPTDPDPAETYLLDNEAPTVTGIVRRTPATQNTIANTVIFTVIFSDQVESIDVGDFTLDTTGSLTATVDSVSATEGDRVDVTVTDVDGEGTVSLDVLASATLTDNAGNGLSTGFTDGEFYRRDTTTPTVEINPVRPLLQDGVVTPAPNSIRIRFSEAVTGFEVNDLSLTRNGNAINLNGATLTANNANTIFTLGNLSTLTAPDGNYSLTLNAGTAGIIDGVGNALTDGDEIDWVRASTSPVPPIVPIFNPSNPPERIAGTVREDILRGTNGPDFIQARARNDVARGLGGNDRITGQTGDDRLFGGGGSDRLIGGPGNDILSGQGNADFIEGNRGRDILRGGAGNDTLVGGIGNDTLIGGGGADVYRFNVARDARDTIQRFDTNSDVIDLTNLFDRPNYQGASPVQRFFDYVVIGTTADGGTSIRIDEDGSGPSRETYTLVELEGVAPSLVSSRNFVIG